MGKKKKEEFGTLFLRDDIFLNNFKQFNLRHKAELSRYLLSHYNKGRTGEKNTIALTIFSNFFSFFEDLGLFLMAVKKWKAFGKVRPIVCYFLQQRSGDTWDDFLGYLRVLNLKVGINDFALCDPKKIHSYRYWRILRGHFKNKDELEEKYLSDLDNAFYGIVNAVSFRGAKTFRDAFNNVKHGQRFLLNLQPASARVFLKGRKDSRIRTKIKTLDLDLSIKGILNMYNFLENATRSARVFVNWFELCNFPSNIDIGFWFEIHPKEFGKNYKPLKSPDLRIE